MDLPEKRLSFDTTSRSSTSSSDSCSSPSPIGAGKLPNGYHSRVRSSLTSQESTNVVKGVARTRDLLNQLERGDYPDHDELVDTLKFVGNILSVVAEKNSPINELNEALPHVLSDEVRAWLTSTFTENRAPSLSRSDRRPPSFKAVVGTIMVGQYIGKMIESQAKSYPAGVTEFFEEEIDQWNCNMFKLEILTDVHPLKYTAYEIFNRCQLLKQFRIPVLVFETFLSRVEEGYQLYNNPYHNSTHAADVLQTVYSIIRLAKLETWFTELEILSLLFAAVIHDLEHTGTTNKFHIQSYSELSLCYNDQSVLENYHVNRAYIILQQENANIFKNLTPEQFAQVRSMTIEMVLGTDMSKHFDQLKIIQKMLSSNEWGTDQNSMRMKVMSFILHTADISHPAKKWELHEPWTDRLIEEFFRQGDREKSMGLPCSPLCDRMTTQVPESQKGFIEYVIRPSFNVFGDVMEFITRKRITHDNINTMSIERTWDEHLNDNVAKWNKKC